MFKIQPRGCRVMHKSSSSLAEVLTPIWERVLLRPGIRVDDNFFDLGGDSLLAVQLFSEIARVSGRELAPVTIYCAPTIAALAEILEEPSAPRFPPLLQLKEGVGAPLFLAHGLGGTAMDFFQLVKHLQTQRPIYGMQAKGTDGVDEPFDRIEDLAQFYLDAIKKMQPHGPYFLVGYSLGGLVALEMAQRLSCNGERVALLAMLDAYPYIRFMTLKQQIRLIAHQVRRGLSNLRSLSVSSLYQPPVGVSLTPAMQHVREKGYLALTRYRPRF